MSLSDAVLLPPLVLVLDADKAVSSQLLSDRPAGSSALLPNPDPSGAILNHAEDVKDPACAGLYSGSAPGSVQPGVRLRRLANMPALVLHPGSESGDVKEKRMLAAGNAPGAAESLDGKAEPHTMRYVPPVVVVLLRQPMFAGNVVYEEYAGSSVARVKLMLLLAMVSMCSLCQRSSTVSAGSVVC